MHSLTKARNAIGWTQTKLASESGVAQSTISIVEAGSRETKFSPTSAKKILDAMKHPLAMARRRGVKVSLALEDLIFAPRARA